MRMAKLTSKNQLTLPKAVVEALGSPRHFRIQVHEGVLLLWPGPPGLRRGRGPPG